MNSVFHFSNAIFFSFILFFYSCQPNTGSASNIDAVAFYKKITENTNSIILDVRTPEEYGKGKIENARNIDFNGRDFKNQIQQLNKNDVYFIYCLSGGRSRDAAAYMKSIGFENIYELNGGLLAWSKENLPLVNVENTTTSELTKEDFNALVISGEIVLVDFYAPWCKPCKKMKPMLNEIKQDLGKKFQLVEIDIDKNPTIAKQLGVFEIPTFKLFINGAEGWTHKGIISKKELLDKIKS